MDRHLWQTAVSFASRAHHGQFRKDEATPFAAHPSRVVMTLAAAFGCTDETILAAAALHDTIEDTTTDYDDLAEQFGRDVAGLVAALTKNATLPEGERERDYDARLARADWRARLIKLADCYDNLCDEARPAKPAKVRRKCRRALALAKGDAATHPETARGISMLQAALKGKRA
jgi:guanosine-3',5'-bis(diphosphate) 3'-pyrophosphohydrolase